MAAISQPMAGAGPSMTMEMRVSCTNLPNLDVTSKSDPLCIVSTRDPATGSWLEVGRTEWIQDNLNPSFVTPIRINYHFELEQRLKFSVYDIDHPKAAISAQDFIGESEVLLSTIVVDKAGVYNGQLRHPSHATNRGAIRVVSEEVQQVNDEALFTIEARDLIKCDVFGLSDPYLVIQQLREGGITVPVVKTEYIPKTLNPKWKPLVVPMATLCNGDLDRPLVVQVYDWNKHNAHELIGSFQTCARQLFQTDGPRQFELQNPAQKKKKKKLGTVAFVKCELRKNPSFIEFLRAGCEVSLIAAVDMTASNGDPRSPQSLHFMNPSAPNAYVQALSAVGSILAPYDHDQMFPAYGFGARMPDGSTSHCFALNGNPSNPEVAGIAGIIGAYQETLTKVQLYGPTIFAQIIQTASAIADMNSRDPSKQRYFILLIITDGAVNDLSATIDSVVAAANSLPLSIIIVGVGNADFSAMEALDADKAALRDSRGTPAVRDIVQFVPINKYAGNPAKLAEETLAEVPGQLVGFMKMRGLSPLKAI